MIVLHCPNLGHENRAYTQDCNARAVHLALRHPPLKSAVFLFL